LISLNNKTYCVNPFYNPRLGFTVNPRNNLTLTCFENRVFVGGIAKNRDFRGKKRRDSAAFTIANLTMTRRYGIGILRSSLPVNHSLPPKPGIADRYAAGGACPA